MAGRSQLCQGIIYGIISFCTGILMTMHAGALGNIAVAYKNPIFGTTLNFLGGTVILGILVGLTEIGVIDVGKDKPKKQAAGPSSQADAELAPATNGTNGTNGHSHSGRVAVADPGNDVESNGSAAQKPIDELVRACSKKSRDADALEPVAAVQPRPRGPPDELRWWMFLGGFVGFPVVCMISLLLPVLGFVVLFVFMVSGQVLGSIFYDHVGLLNMPIKRFSPRKHLLPMTIVFMGLAFVVVGGSRKSQSMYADCDDIFPGVREREEADKEREQAESGTHNPSEGVPYGLAIFIAFCCGVYLPVQAILNFNLAGVLVKKYNKTRLYGAFVSFIGGAAGLVVTLLAVHYSELQPVDVDYDIHGPGVPWYNWMTNCGIVGTVFVYNAQVISPIIGVTFFQLYLTTGQLVFSVPMDLVDPFYTAYFRTGDHLRSSEDYVEEGLRVATAAGTPVTANTRNDLEAVVANCKADKAVFVAEDETWFWTWRVAGLLCVITGVVFKQLAGEAAAPPKPKPKPKIDEDCRECF